jgi:hypothetical protein
MKFWFLKGKETSLPDEQMPSSQAVICLMDVGTYFPREQQ